MREVRDVLAGPEPRGNSEHAGRKASASSGVDDEIRLLAGETRRRRDRLGSQGELRTRFARGVRLKLGPSGHIVDAGGDCLGEQHVVEVRARDVVGVREDRGRKAVEGDAHPVGLRPDERDAGFDSAEARRLFFQVEPLEDRHHGRDERFADEQRGTAPVVEERHVRALASEQDRQRGARGPGAYDRDPHASSPVDAGFQFAPLHPIPSRMTSTILAASMSVTTPSIQDTTRLFRPPQRLKNTPIPGLGGTTGT